MKFFKGTLSIAILFAANSTFAARTVAAQAATEGSDTAVMPAAKPVARGKVAAKKPAAKKTTAKKPVARGKATVATSAPIMEEIVTSFGTYPEMLTKIKTMPAAQVISGNSLNPTFIKSIVDNPNLAPAEREALLQAGVNMHATWSGNNAQDSEKLASFDLQVGNGAQTLWLGEEKRAVTPWLGEERRPAAAPAQSFSGPVPSFYDLQTAMLKTQVLNKDIKELRNDSQLTDKSPETLTSIILTRYLDQMLLEWANRGVEGEAADLTQLLEEQIAEAIQNAFENQTAQQQAKALPAVPQPILFGATEWNAAPAQKKSFDPNYLETMVKTVVQNKGSALKGENANMWKNRIVGLVNNAIIDDMKSEWDQDKLEDLKNIVNKTLHNQIVSLVEQARS